MIEIHLRHGQSHPTTGALTDEGRHQAEIAGAYVRREFPRAFEIAVHSPSTRTRHTAELLGLPVA